MSSTLTHAIAIYPILHALSTHLSTLDLLHLALTTHYAAAQILDPETFTILKRQARCDGRGLCARQEFQGSYNGHHWSVRDSQTEEAELRVWAKKCNDCEALPCTECGINVCGECIYLPRALNYDGRDPSRRPHLNGSYQAENMICYCWECDGDVERRIGGEGGEGRLCECDRYTRWICWRCHCKEEEFIAWYGRFWTRFDSVSPMEEPGMALHDHCGMLDVSRPPPPSTPPFGPPRRSRPNTEPNPEPNPDFRGELTRSGSIGVLVVKERQLMGTCDVFGV